MSATTAYQPSPVTPNNALIAAPSSSNNTSPLIPSLNTAAAHSVYPMVSQSGAPGNSSGNFATGNNGSSQPSQGSSLPPMVVTEPGIAATTFYGAPAARPYPTQTAMYPQPQAHAYHHQSNQGQHQSQYTVQTNNGPHQAYNDSQYASPTYTSSTAGYPQPTTPVHPSYAAGYGHGRSDSMGSWHAPSETYDYVRHTSISSSAEGGRASGKGEPFLMADEEELPRPAPSYAALIGEALLLADPPHQLYVSEISDSIKARYPFYRQFPSKIYNGVRHQTSMCKAFVKIPRPFGDQSGGARKWAIRAGCQTWFRDGDYHPPISPPSTTHNKNRGGKKRSTGNSKQLAIGHDALSPNLSSVNGPSDGPPWDPVRHPLPWLARFRASRLGPQQQVQEQQLIPRAQPAPPQTNYGLIPSQYAQQPSAYAMTPTYTHQQQYYGGGSGDWGAYQHSAAHYYASPSEHGGNWRPPSSNFNINEAPFPRSRPAMLNSDEATREDAHPHSRGHLSPHPEGEYQFNDGQYPKRETSTPLSSPPPGADTSDA
ncbi:hypothetical protein CC85DRAFT_323400 [Cutaneotrichosporon oleaginosum]|uniref:Fork-head domain-containing protein n=1 Tax=Cutaneotrichosporon oleaginosum TaxID=879819 RepID=A0A0J1AW92_9TREE|nr:uncharacterized protein CC85DRAFT_323400 [Cutaneotrichosporon oleaginosum]KLT39549.1 hypothetical protein CC85DRAFT_323400 [Cutaneotrichosporon oleaginosum]TXT08009.1 hypothetical protein COLE_04933 [Cutaneotrichosporon oleaginosum]